MVRIAYIAQSRIPSRAANSVQIMKMAEELLARDPELRRSLGELGAAEVQGNTWERYCAAVCA